MTAGLLDIVNTPQDAIPTAESGISDYDFALIQIPDGTYNNQSLFARIAGMSGDTL